MKKFINILKYAGLFAVACLFFVLGMNSFSCEPAWAAVPEWVSWVLLVCSFVVFYIFAVNLIRVWSRKDDSDKTPEPPKPGKWDFIYEEGYPDIGVNQSGVISDGVNFLFYHAYKIEMEDPIETCIVYSSISMLDEFEECRYPWTAENDEILLEALNGADRDPYVAGSFCGEQSVLRTLEFKHYVEK